MIIDLGYWTRVAKKILTTIIVIIGLYFAFKLSVFYMPFLIAFIISALIEPVIKMVNKKTNLTRKTSAKIVLIVVTMILIVLLSFGIFTLIKEATELLQGINQYYEEINNLIQNVTNYLKTNLIEIPVQVQEVINNSTQNFLNKISNIVQNFLGSLLEKITSLPTVLIYVGVTLLSIYFICVDRLFMLDQLEHHFPKSWVRKIGKHLKEVLKQLGNFLKAEVVLAIIAFVELLVGLTILKYFGFNIPFPLIVALLIAFVDALPMLGSGLIMFPWAVISALKGDINLAIALIVLWLVIVIVRQLLEPKILSSKIGIHPIFTIIAMYTGLRLIGVIGLLIGPIILIIFKSIFGTLIENGVFKTLFDRS